MCYVSKCEKVQNKVTQQSIMQWIPLCQISKSQKDGLWIRFLDMMRFGGNEVNL